MYEALEQLPVNKLFSGRSLSNTCVPSKN